MEHEKFFSIGQFAALHGINKKTLMWYDEIGLFRPKIVKENGYRYYTYRQSSILETILMLRELNMSIPEISAFLNNRSTERYVALLQEKIEDAEREIRHLKSIRNLLKEQHDAFSFLQNADLTRIELIEKEEETFYIIASSDNSSLEEEIETVINSVKKHKFKSLHDTTYGSLISVTSLQNSEFERYDGLFMRAVRPDGLEEIHIKPRGTYLRAYCKGNWDRLPQRYQEILSYAARHGLTPYGYAYESGINEITITSMDEYITQIEIPVRT